MTVRAHAATGLALLGVAYAAVAAITLAVVGAPLLIVVPLAGCALAWLALHRACARPSRSADVRLVAVLVFLAGASVLLVSFGGSYLWLPVALFVASGVLLPRT